LGLGFSLGDFILVEVYEHF